MSVINVAPIRVIEEGWHETLASDKDMLSVSIEHDTVDRVEEHQEITMLNHKLSMEQNGWVWTFTNKKGISLHHQLAHLIVDPHLLLLFQLRFHWLLSVLCFLQCKEIQVTLKSRKKLNSHTHQKFLGQHCPLNHICFCGTVSRWFLATKPGGCLVHSVTSNPPRFGHKKPSTHQAISDHNRTILAISLFEHCFAVESLRRQGQTTFLEQCGP